MTNPTQIPEQPQNDKAMNFELIRKQLDQERVARQQAEARIAEVERIAKERMQPPAPAMEDDEGDEPYVDHKRLNKKMVNFKKTIDEDIDKRVEQKARQMMAEERRVNYIRENPDFQNVMASDETLQRFADNHKALADKILKMPEGFERNQLVYENIKALGIDKPAKKDPSIQDKIDANRRSPYYQPSGQGSAPYQSVGDFSDQGKKAAHDKMQELKKRLRI